MNVRNNVKTILIDDDLKGRKAIEGYMSKIEELEVSEVFDDTQSAYKFMTQNVVELIVINSEIKETNSADFLKKIDENIAVVYLHSNLDVQQLDVDSASVNYLFKTTLNLPKFKKAIEKANIYIKTSNTLRQIPMEYNFNKNYFFVRENLVSYKLKYEDVSHISALENYIKIHTSQKTHMVLSTLRQFEQSINDNPFFRVHRSFIINFDYVSTIAKDVITLTNDIQVPIGEQYKKDLEAIFMTEKTIKR